MHPGYAALQFTHSNFRLQVEEVAKILKQLREKPETNFDALVVCGKSGMSIAFGLKMIMDIDVVFVRKAGDKTHGMQLECPDGFFETSRKLLFLDDCIATGSTFNRAARVVQKDGMQIVGILLYGAEKNVLCNLKEMQLCNWECLKSKDVKFCYYLA